MRRKRMDGEPRPDQRWCRRCERWQYCDRFYRYTRNEFVTEFSTVCKACQQKERNEKKNEDRPRSLVGDRAQREGARRGYSKEFMMVNMGYEELVEPYRLAMSQKVKCPSCLHPFSGEHDIHFDHKDPPRHLRDTARLHARNIQLLCASCNRTKGNKSHSDWLDEQEDARLANEGDVGLLPHPPAAPPKPQLRLFE